MLEQQRSLSVIGEAIYMTREGDQVPNPVVPQFLIFGDNVRMTKLCMTEKKLCDGSMEKPTCALNHQYVVKHI